MAKPKASEVAATLASISASAKRHRCVVADLLDTLPPAAKQAFEIAMKADRDEYPHTAIQRRLEELTGKHLGKGSIPKHRLGVTGDAGGCACGRN